MPEKEPKIYPEQPKEPPKLTPEEVKEMVEKYKEEHEGLLPEYFALPGEEKEEKREYSEETILAYELKEFLEKIRPGLENEQLIKNAGEKLKSDIESGQKSGYAWSGWDAVHGYLSFKQSGLWLKFDQKFRDWIEENIQHPQLIKDAGEYLKSKIEYGQKPGNTAAAWWAVYGYAFFKQSDLWSKLDQKSQDWIEKNIKNSQLIKKAEKDLKSQIESGQKSGNIGPAWDAVYGYTSFKQSGLWFKLDQESRDWIEENIQNPQLIKNAEEELKSKIESGQKPDKTMDAWDAVFGYASFFQFQKILEEQGRKKDAMKESQKAMHPEKKKLPPMPEEKAF